MPSELLNLPRVAIRHRTHRRFSRRASIAADFGRQVNQRNNDGQRAHDLADCTNRFPISQHGLIMIVRISVESPEDFVA